MVTSVTSQHWQICFGISNVRSKTNQRSKLTLSQDLKWVFCCMLSFFFIFRHDYQQNSFRKLFPKTGCKTFRLLSCCRTLLGIRSFLNTLLPCTFRWKTCGNLNWSLHRMLGGWEYMHCWTIRCGSTRDGINWRRKLWYHRNTMFFFLV